MIAQLLVVATLPLAPPRVLSLDDALRTAGKNQPQLRHARANTQAQKARQDQARAPLLPWVSGQATYQRATGNYAPRPGAVPSAINQNLRGSTFDTFDFFNFNVTASQTVWDFGGTYYRWKQAEALTRASTETEHAVVVSIAAGVRVAYFAARAQKSLVEVARETLANQQRHLQQIQGFVTVGTRPEIDLAQARTDTSNAQVQLINAENAYEVTKAQLNQAMGVEGPTDYDVVDESLPPVDVEEQPPETLVAEAVKTRPELRALEEQVRAQKKAIDAARGAFGPSIGVSTTLSDAGTDINNLAWNWNATATLTWPVFQGLLTWSQVKEAQATLASIEAQRDVERQSVRLEVDQARLQVRAARAALAASEEALTNARERLRLAEGRYGAGVGNVIELGDAQVALTNAAAQRVQAAYSLASARAQLLKALGRA